MMNLTFDTDNTIRISGSVDIFCAEQLKTAVHDQGYTSHITLDMQKVEYIDSSGIGALISLYNEFAARSITITILPSPGIARIFSTSKLDSLFFAESRGTATRDPKTITFHESFEADTRILAFLIDRLFEDLSRAGYAEEEGQEIVVAVDEAITNAVLETIKATGEVLDNFSVTLKKGPLKMIAVKWEITPEDFTATVIDHGAGLDLDEVQQRTPQTGTGDYLNQVDDYQHKCNLCMRVNGQNVELKRLGAGLKIMATFMDDIFIDLIDSCEIISSTVSHCTTGTILTLHRSRRHRAVSA